MRTHLLVTIVTIVVLSFVVALQASSAVISLSNQPSLVESDLWVKHGVVLKSDQPWEGPNLGEMSARWENETFRLWYNSGNGLAYAISADGIHNFIKKGIVYVDPLGMGAPYVEKMQGQYWLYYKGFGGTMHLAQSSDGISNWIPRGIVLRCGEQAWESCDLQNPSVIYDPSTNQFDMIYESNSFGYNKLGLATSSDGINWTKYSGNPVISGVPGTWSAGGVGAPYLFKWKMNFYILYCGIPYAGGWQIGIAKSSDLIHWTESTYNPIIQSTLASDGVHICDPSLVYNGRSVVVYYNSNQSTISMTYSYASLDELLSLYGVN